MEILAWVDTPIVATGFGTVSRHILKRLYNDGHSIELVGINQLDTWYDQNIYPYKIHSPLTLFGFNQDQFGVGLISKHIVKGKFDVLLTINDKGILNELVPTVREARKKHDFKWVIYMPYDWDYIVAKDSDAYSCIREADKVVFFHDKVLEMYQEAFPELIEKMSYIHHGVSQEDFHKISPKERREFRKGTFKIDDDKFLIINVNRNQPRKDLPRTLEIYKLFKEKHKDVELYLHCKSNDMGGNIHTQAVSLGMKPDSFYITPSNYSENKGYKISALNALYNSGDVYISTTLGEGWGLTSVEAMATGRIVLLPDNTTARTIIGDNERGELMACGTTSSEWVLNKFDDAKRPLTNIESALEKLEKVYQAWKGDTQLQVEYKHKIRNAQEWIEQNTWDKVCEQWSRLFKSLK